MEKILNLALNQFETIPRSLRDKTTINVPKTEVSVNLASLYHHYYLDSHGRRPPDPDPAHFEYLEFLLPTKEFRFCGDGLGVNGMHRRIRSAALGQAFCRMFLHDHLGIVYFAHMDRVINRTLHPAFSGLHVEEIRPGDKPDYFCANSVNKVFLAEAKGRYSSINFANKEFEEWRKQFTRVAIKDSSGKSLRVKGYIVATRFAAEAKPSIKSGIFAEDPESPGEIILDENRSRELGEFILRSHYSEIALKLNQPILASALTNGFRVPEEIQFPTVIWELRVGPLQGKRFVGGYYPSTEGNLPFRYVNGQVSANNEDPLRLDVSRGTFFGVEETIFRQMAAMTRIEKDSVEHINISQFEQIEPFYSGISILRDGSVISPLEFFSPITQALV